MQDFYDRYPYPRPVESLEKYRRLWQDPLRRRADYHLFWPAKPYRDGRSILIAGCGTSQAAKHAARWPAARVTGIDFSTTSVRCTEELKRKYRLDNLQVCRLPIERVGDLESSFDQIVCTGVLHHLADPDMGLELCATCSSRTERCISWCTRRTDGPASTCCRTSAGVSASVPPTTRSGISSVRSVLCPPGIRWKPSARSPGLPARGRTRRCPLESAGPGLFGATTLRLPREGRTDLRSLGETGALRPSVRCHVTDPAGLPDSAAFSARAVCGRRTVPRERWSATALLPIETTVLVAINVSVSLVTLGLPMCRFARRTRSVFRSGFLPGPRPS